MTRILIVDDDEVDREAVRRGLAGLSGLDFLEARDGEEGLARVEADRPDLVLTDLRMPRRDGLELLRALRRDHPAVIPILLTSQGSERIAVEALRAGALSYVPKASLDEALADTVTHALEMLAARRSRVRLRRHLVAAEARFELENDPALIAPLAAHLQEGLERLGCGDDALRTQIGVALVEALSNAMIHGNLEVSSALRQRDHEAYDAEIARRRTTDPHASRRVRCTARQTAERVEYTVVDEGPGFDPGALPDPTRPENLLRLSGRGVLLIRTFMDEVAWSDGGRTLVMRKAFG